ncbi:MAG: AarF/UbiB family protein [Limnochordales bacterium]|nr:AarF/UbiB family protein [Limnochordales bacterium]
MPLGFMQRRYRHWRRYRQVVEVLLRHGFGYALDQLDLQDLVPFGRRVLPPAPPEQTRGARLRAALEALGPTFVKLGQILSTRPDIVPEDVVEELSLLQDHVPAVPVDQVIPVVEAELGRPLSEAFASFDPEPLAAASIGQVHRATLPDGTGVAVKVRRPGVEEVVETDLEILQDLARLIEERWRPERISPVAFVDEVARVLRREMDYRLEAGNIQRFRRAWAGDPRVRIPRVYWDLTTSRVLVMEYLSGVKVDDRAGLERLGVDPRQIARLGAEIFLQQVLIDGVFHGDPHPGNLLVLDDGSLGMLDFGIVGRLDQELLDAVADLFVGVTRRDTERIVRGLTRVGAVGDDVDPRALRRDLSDLIDRHYGKTLQQMELGPIVQEILRLAHRHQLRLPEDLLLLAKALVTIEGVGKHLDPDFNALEIAEPFARELMERQLDPAAVARRALAEAGAYLQLLGRLPERVDESLSRLVRGEIQIQFVHKGLDPTVQRLERTSNRVAMSVVLAALILGSAIILQAHAGPTVWGVPVLGVLGFVMAAFLGLGLVIGILRSGRF